MAIQWGNHLLEGTWFQGSVVVFLLQPVHAPRRRCLDSSGRPWIDADERFSLPPACPGGVYAALAIGGC